MAMAASPNFSAAVYATDLPDPMSVFEKREPVPHCCNQRRRRADILCNARRMLAAEGYRGVSLREVADRSEVSVQTVYNLVGSRTTVLADAVVGHIAANARASFEREAYPNAILALSDAYWESAICYPQYTRNAVMTYFPPDRLLYDQIHRRGIAILRDGFRRMSSEGKLRSVDVQTLSMRIAAMHAIVTLDGLSGYLDNASYRREMVNGVGLMLLPSVTSQHGEEIKAWLADFDLWGGTPRDPSIVGK